MTYYQAISSQPPDQLARLLLCPNETVRRGQPIPCSRGTDGHTNCDDCITKFLQTEVSDAEA